MRRLSDDIVRFFHRQNFTVVTTIDKDGSPHNSCKGVVDIDPNGKVYLLDLFKARTYENLRHNHRVSVTAIDEHRFKGYCLKGRAKEIRTTGLKPGIIKAWDKKINSRITHRIIKNIRGEKGHPRHPEALLPGPEYLIVMEVEEIINLSPPSLK